MNNYYRYFLFCLIVLGLSWLTKETLISDTLYFNTLADQLTYEQIETMIAQGKKWEWLGYALVPLVYLIKFSLVALVLSLGVWMATNRFWFTSLFAAAIEAEVIFLIPVIAKLLWFLFLQPNYTLQDLQLFYPLSLLSMFDPDTLEAWWLYPLQVLNVFEVVYWGILAYLVAPLLRHQDGQETEGFFDRLGRGLGIVSASYGAGLVVWVALVMFLTLSYS